jgi:hypothetical protein
MHLLDEVIVQDGQVLTKLPIPNGTYTLGEQEWPSGTSYVLAEVEHEETYDDEDD